MNKGMCRQIFILILALLPVQVWAGFKPATPIKILVKAQYTDDHALASDLQALLTNLVNSIRHDKNWWTLVDEADDAQLVLILVSRTETSTYEYELVPEDEKNPYVFINEYRLSSQLVAGDHQAFIEGTFRNKPGGIDAWWQAEGNLLTNVQQWVKKNYDQVISNRSKATATPVQSVATPAAPTTPAANPAPGKGPFTNQDVIALVSAGLDEQNTLAAIREAEKVNFDLSTDGLKKLLAVHVSNKVIAAMRERQAENHKH